MTTTILSNALRGRSPSRDEALTLANETDTRVLMDVAADIRDQTHRNVITYSRKVFVPLTQLCRDVCHYCTFAQAPKVLEQPYVSVDQVLETARHGADTGCKEVLFTLGEKPELRYAAAREALAGMGYGSTLEYLRDVAEQVFEKTGLLPHLNPGTMTPAEIATLREVAPSMGLMLESGTERLTAEGMPHHGSPDKDPAVRLRNPERCRRGEGSVYHRDPDRDRRNAARADRVLVADPRCA